MLLAVVLSHPTQYYSPWFRYLAQHGLPDLRAFYLSGGGASHHVDADFGIPLQWDIPLVDGYAHQFVANHSRHPGTHRISGLHNPDLIEEIQCYSPDAVLVFGYNFRSLYRLIFSTLPARIPFLFRGDSHRLIPRTSLKETLRRLWIGKVYSKFAAFLYVGRANKQYFLHHNVSEHQLYFCPHCVDNDRFFAESKTAANAACAWKEQLGIPPGERVLLFAGKLIPKKRPLDLVAAFKRANLAGVTLLVVGNGSQEAELRQQAAGNKRILIAPFQNQSRMPMTYAAADLFVLPSYGLEETWGLAVNEAMCMSRPVIVSDHVGCAQDLVETNANGLIFPAGNVTALATALSEAFSDPDRLRRWGHRSRQIIRRYSYEHATQALLTALQVGRRGLGDALQARRQ